MVEQLQKLLRPMDLPDFRKSGTTVHNFKWLAKNLKVRNATHKNYDSAMDILSKLTK